MSKNQRRQRVVPAKNNRQRKIKEYLAVRQERYDKLCHAKPQLAGGFTKPGSMKKHGI